MSKGTGSASRLFTVVNEGVLPFSCTPDDGTLLLGSCFSDEMAARMTASGFDILANPFGTLYNPLSVLGALRCLAGDAFFGPDDCVEMGAGAGKVCSFYHHTRFARHSREEFLACANGSLSDARKFLGRCRTVIITFGTARVWEHIERDMVVANCLKRDGREFTNRMLPVDECAAAVRNILRLCGNRKVIFTVSPIRHLGYGAFDNTVSKATLSLALRDARVCYFPAYEILNDELRDYRFYAGDMLHPSSLAVDIIWDRFLKAAVPASCYPDIERAQACSKAVSHIPGGIGTK